MKLKSLLAVGAVAIAASALASSVAQRSMSGRVSGVSAPAFSLADTRGRPVSLEGTLKGRKAVLLNFWFAACGPCREEFPHLQKLYQKYKPAGLEVVAINATDGAAAIDKFKREFGLSMPVALDSTREISAAYKVTGTPTNVLIDARGNVIWRSEGFDKTGLEQVLEETLAT